MDNILQAIDKLTNQIKETEKKLSDKIDTVDQKLCQFQTELNDLKQCHEEQEKRLDQIEKQVRIRNLVIFGIEDRENTYSELEETVKKIIIERLNVKLETEEIQHVFRIGKKSTKPRPINVGFTTLGKKICILKNKSKLEGTPYYIKEDFPKKILKIRESLQEELKSERQKGRKVMIKYDKIIAINKKRSLELSPSPKTTQTNNENESSVTPTYPAKKKNKFTSEITQYLKQGEATPQRPINNSTQENRLL